MKDVHPHNMRHTKTLQFALQKARSNSVMKTLKYIATEIWSHKLL